MEDFINLLDGFRDDELITAIKEMEVGDLVAMFEALGEEIYDLRGRLSDADETIQDMKQDEQSLLKLIEALKEDKADLESQLSEASEEIMKRMQSNKNLREENDKLFGKITDLKNHLSMLMEYKNWVSRVNQNITRSYMASAEALCYVVQNDRAGEIMEKLNRRVMDS